MAQICCPKAPVEHIAAAHSTPVLHHPMTQGSCNLTAQNLSETSKFPLFCTGFWREVFLPPFKFLILPSRFAPLWTESAFIFFAKWSVSYWGFTVGTLRLFPFCFPLFPLSKICCALVCNCWNCRQVLSAAQFIAHFMLHKIFRPFWCDVAMSHQAFTFTHLTTLRACILQ